MMKPMICKTVGAFLLVVSATLVSVDASRSETPPLPEAQPVPYESEAQTPTTMNAGVWTFTVQYRTRRNTRSNWGPYQTYSSYTGSYGPALARANRDADYINGLSKNYQSRILQKRIR